jgi:DNA-binding LytR/AlgR family response regulator
MKIRIETDSKLSEPEIVIYCKELDDEAIQLQTAVVNTLKTSLRLALVKAAKEYYLPPDQVLFFESVDGKTYAHTAGDVFTVGQKLYELEATLPHSFLRISKSAIIGTRYILAISRNLTGPSTVQFRGSHKQVSVSRSYYKQLVNKLSERSLK